MVPAAGSRGLGCFREVITSMRHSGLQRSCHGTPRDSCTPSERPPCPPCESPAPPPCRPTTRESTSAIRKVCCAPPAGQRPPCPPPAPPRPLTCNNISKDKNHTVEQRQIARCGAQLDRVAQRLAAAENRRREQYEHEARQLSKPKVTPLPAKTYSLQGVQHCARATDGHDYMCAQTPTPARTCVNGIPPPPVSVPLKSSKGCEVQSSVHLDPCAHKPRVFIEIDRSATVKSTEKSSVQSNSMSTCDRKQCNNEKLEKEWCKSPPELAKVPPPCREPTLVERLRRGIGGSEGKPQHRALHTRAVPCFFPAGFIVPASDNTCHIDKLSVVLKDFENYEESGRGRTVGLGNNDYKKTKKSNLGALELPIPPDANAVRVSVTLDVAQTAGSVTSKREATSKCMRRGGSDSWLSIKNIQKKLTSSKKTSDPKPSVKETSCPVQPRAIPANPCAPSRSHPPKSPRTPTPANPCAPKDNRTRSASTFYPLYLLS